jgi:hypothetical protein
MKGGESVFQDSLLAQIMAEAKSGSGTWALATYVKLRDSAERFTEWNARAFVVAILNEMCNPSNGPRTRFKLAQLCSSIHCWSQPPFEAAFQAESVRLSGLRKELANRSNLDKSTIALLDSIERQKLPSNGVRGTMPRGRITTVIASLALTQE